MEQGHNTRTLIDPDGNEIEIDLGISPLISEIWKANIKTIACCENYYFEEGWIWIKLPVEDAKKLLSILSEYDEDIHSLYNRIHRQINTDGYDIYEKEGECAEGTWRYGVQPRDLRRIEREVGDKTMNYIRLLSLDITFDISVIFPTWDYDEVLRRIKEFNNERLYLQRINDK